MISQYPPFLYSSTQTSNFNKELGILDEMDRGARQYPGVTYNNSKNCGNVDSSYNTKFVNCNICTPDEKGRVLEWLSPLASRERHQAIRESRAGGVGDWLLRDQSFSTWHTSEDRAAKPVLLCYGDPGVGKTHISSLVIDTLSKGTDGDSVGVAYVYCDYNARNAQSAGSVLGSVLRQVIGALPEIPGEVQKAFEHAKRHIDGCRLLLPEILEKLIKYLPCLKRVFICIDALDEFPAGDRPELWESLQRIIMECPNTRLFLTGRPQIRDGVRRHLPRTTEMLPISTREHDIELYLRMRLDRDPEPGVMDEELRTDILRVIPERISRIFLLVSISMNAILAEATVHKRKQTLYRMTNGLGLYEAYSTTIDRIRQQDGSKSDLGMDALMWVSHSERALKSWELCHALGVELRARDFNSSNVPPIQTVLGCALGLVTIDEETSTVRLLHFTLQEYLGEHPTLFVTPHPLMAEVCLTYLNYRSVRALAGATLLEYATCFWGTHAAREVTAPVKALALRLLNGYENHVSSAILWQKKIRKWCLMEDVQGISGLHCIAFWGIEEIAVAMPEMERWDVNARDSRGNTPLLWAVKYRNYGLVELFLRQEDIEPDAVVQGGHTVLSFAAESGNEGALKLLLGRADINPNSSDSDGQTSLSLAVRRGHKCGVMLLLGCRDVNPNSSDNYGRTSLSYAAEDGREDLVKLLLERADVSPNSPDNNGRTALSLAASEGHEGVVKSLLEHGGVNPNALDNRGRPPLSYASSRGHRNVVSLLLESPSIDPASPDSNGLTPLAYAAKWGGADLVKVFLDRGGVNADSLDTKGRTPLSYAASEGHKDVMRQLLERGDVNANLSDMDGRTPLSFAAAAGHEGAVKLLLQSKCVKPDYSDSKGRTPLLYASSRGHGGVVGQLLQCEDVNPNSLDHIGRPPLSYAVAGGHKCAVKLLVESPDIDPNLSDSSGRTPLSYAAKWGREDLVKQFLESGGVDPDSPDSKGRTPLAFAAMKGHGGVVELLLQCGNVNPNSVDSSGRSVLSYAAAGRNKCVVGLLVESPDIDPNSSDSSGRTPLSYAAKWGRADLVKLFLQRGGTNPNSSDGRCRTPLSYASSEGHEGVVKLLLEVENVDPDSPDCNGRTPLSFAAEWGREDVVRLLLERKDASPNSLDNNGRLPLSYAASRGHVGVAKLLVKSRDIDPTSSGSRGLTPLLRTGGLRRQDLVEQFLEPADANPDSSDNKLVSGPINSNCGSLENRDQMPAPVTGESASHQEVTDPLTATEGVTLRTADDPPLGAPITAPIPLAPPQQQPPSLSQRPPDLPRLPPAPPAPIPALCSRLFLLSLFPFVFLFFSFLIYFRYGDSGVLFQAIQTAWR